MSEDWRDGKLSMPLQKKEEKGYGPGDDGAGQDEDVDTSHRAVVAENGEEKGGDGDQR